MSLPPGSPPGDLAHWRLPKALDPARSQVLHGLLCQHATKLWEQGVRVVPTAPWSPGLRSVLLQAGQAEHLVRGLELAEKKLASEAHGLSLVDARSGSERGVRVCRLLLLSRDGTERFYRQAERVLAQHGGRLLGVRLDVDAGELGRAVFDTEGVVRAVLVEHKDSVSRVLLALYSSDAAA